MTTDVQTAVEVDRYTHTYAHFHKTISVNQGCGHAPGLKHFT